MNRVWRRVTKTGPIFQNSVKIDGIRRSEFKNRRNIVHYFKISEKDKNQKKIYVKKLDPILRLPVKKFL
jgi:hypothetical protein